MIQTLAVSSFWLATKVVFFSTFPFLTTVSKLKSLFTYPLSSVFGDDYSVIWVLLVAIELFGTRSSWLAAGLISLNFDAKFLGSCLIYRENRQMGRSSELINILKDYSSDWVLIEPIQTFTSSRSFGVATVNLLILWQQVWSCKNTSCFFSCCFSEQFLVKIVGQM